MTFPKILWGTFLCVLRCVSWMAVAMVTRFSTLFIQYLQKSIKGVGVGELELHCNALRTFHELFAQKTILFYFIIYYLKITPH